MVEMIGNRAFCVYCHSEERSDEESVYNVSNISDYYHGGNPQGLIYIAIAPVVVTKK